MATLTVVPASSAGVEVVAAAAACAAGGDTFANTGQEVVIFTNASVAGIDVTLVTPGTLDGHAISNRVVEIPAASTVAIGPLAPSAYNSDAGFVVMTYETETDLSVKVVKATPA